MSTPLPKESEIVDVLLGEADPALQERIDAAIQADPKAAARYSEWRQVLPEIEKSLQPAKSITCQIKLRVMAKLPQERKALREAARAAQPLPLAPALPASSSGRAWVRRPWLAAFPRALAAASVLLVAGFAAYQGHLRYFRSAHVGMVSGTALVIEQENAYSRPVGQGDRFRLPARVKVLPNAQVELRLPHRSFLMATADSSLYIQNSRVIRQTAGRALYQVDKATRSGRFKVFIPQGAIIDMGTRFEVDLSRTDESKVRVDQGRVSVIPMQGAEITVREGQRAILNSTETVIENIPAFSRQEAEAGRLPRPPEASSGILHREYQPTREPIALNGSLASFIRPVSVSIRPGIPEGKLKKTPPFTSEPVLFGMIPIRLDDRPMELPVVCDRKMTGKWRIHVDSNANGDLTDDPSYMEGEDFLAGKPFRVILSGRNNLVWLSRPIVVEANASPPRVMPVADRLECFNPISLSGEISIPAGHNPGLQQRFLFAVLDTNSDGDYGDPGGSLAFWLQVPAISGGKPQVCFVAPVEAPTLAGGYRWELSRSISGSFLLDGQSLDRLIDRKLIPGEKFPTIRAQTIQGETIELAPPTDGYLLVHVWSTWLCGQRPVPPDFSDLYRRLRPRGLRLVGVSMDLSLRDLVNHVAAKQVPYPQIFNGPDLTKGIAAQMGIDRYPLAILVGPNGKVISIGKQASEIFQYLDERLPKN